MPMRRVAPSSSRQPRTPCCSAPAWSPPPPPASIRASPKPPSRCNRADDRVRPTRRHASASIRTIGFSWKCTNSGKGSTGSPKRAWPLPQPTKSKGRAMFLVCGEALFDMFLRPDESHGLCLDAVPGGSPFNVALGLARLGQRTEFFSGISGDLMGRKLAAFMEKEGIGTAYAIRSAAPTALSIVELDEHGSPDYAFYGDFPAYRTIT